MSTAFYFFGGVADLFLALMIWFILDNSKTVAAVVDGDRIYTVKDVIQTTDSLNSLDLEEDNHEPRTTSLVSGGSSLVSQRMIAQFFTEVEGPDREWKYYDIIEEEDYDHTLVIETVPN